ncbi:hypothetical protein DSECCO2_550740 [anaerobic digester metagenome]
MHRPKRHPYPLLHRKGRRHVVAGIVGKDDLVDPELFGRSREVLDELRKELHRPGRPAKMGLGEPTGIWPATYDGRVRKDLSREELCLGHHLVDTAGRDQRAARLSSPDDRRRFRQPVARRFCIRRDAENARLLLPLCDEVPGVCAPRAEVVAGCAGDAVFQDRVGFSCNQGSYGPLCFILVV